MISVDNTQAVLGDRGKIYVNGVLQSLGTQTATQNVDYHLLTGLTYDIGRTAITNSQYFNGYIAEFHFIDGQALTPSSFGESDAVTGRWKAKAYSGTYGTNGFYLSFKDNTSTTTLGYDDAGSNDWTLNNFSVTAGAENDSLVDSPTNYGADTGVGGEVRGNYCVINPLDFITGSGTLSEGNLKWTTVATGSRINRGTVAVLSGKWYWEITADSVGAGSCLVGVAKTSSYSVASGLAAYQSNTGDSFIDNVTANYGSTWATGAIIGISYDADAGKITFYKNNVSQGELTLSGYAGVYVSPIFYDGSSLAFTLTANFGQRPFAYTAPTGFKALCTTNLPQPTIQNPSKYMDVVAYTGTGASNSISSLGFSPDLVWIKNRGTTTDHAIYDTTRGSQQQLSSNTTGDEATSSSGLTAFNANGFTIGTSSLVNTSGTQYVGWAWDESTQAGLDVVSYTGNGANRTIAHNLGVAPKMVIVKARTTAGADQGWPVFHTSIANTTYLQLNSTSATATGADYWNSTSPTSSVFSVGTNAAVNTSADTYIAYCFAEVDGFSKIGSYAGNALADGTFVYCGFLPSFILIKSSTAIDAWLIYDNKRNTFNVASTNLVPNTTAADATISGIDFVSNGFKLRTITTTPNAAQTYIFAAFAESPFKYARAR
jgi:hypothetical protein